MSLESAVQFYRNLGHQAEAGSQGLWYRVPEGFMVRVPHHVVVPPAPEELAGLLRRYKVLGLRYSLPPGEQGQGGALYFVREANYDLPQLGARMRNRIRRGLKQCTIRVMSCEELQRQGLPLNEDTLARQQRTDSVFTSPDLWARFCRAAGQCPQLQVWGAFSGAELAAYSIVLQIGAVATQLYQMSRTALLPLEVNPALNFTQTYQLMRTPGIAAVSFGHEGLDSAAGLDEYKLSLGYRKEAITSVIKLRPLVHSLLLSRAAAGAVAGLGRARPDSHLFHRMAAVLEIAALSQPDRAAGSPATRGQ